MADRMLKFSVTVTWRFRLTTTDMSKYRCYAEVLKPGNTDLMPGERVIIYGNADMYVDKGMKLAVSGEFERIDTYKDPTKVYKIFETRPERDRTALVAHFSGKRFKGIGKVKANAIVDTLGLDCIKLIREDPSCLKQVKCLTEDMRQDIIEHLEGSDIDNEIRAIYPSVSPKFLDYMNEVHSEDGLMIIRTDPYVLLDERDQCKAIKFDMIDAIGRALGVGMTSIHRIRYCVRDVVRTLAEDGVRGLTSRGNVFVYISDQPIWDRFYQTVYQRLNIDWKFVQDAIESGDAGVQFVRAQAVFSDSLPSRYGVVRCYLTDRLRDEMDAGNILRRLVNTGSIVAKATCDQIRQVISEFNQNYCVGKPLTGEQMVAINTAMTSRVSVLTGGPGYGKSTTVEGVLYAWMKLSVDGIVDNPKFRGSVSLGAPTGMAVRRLDECVSDVKPKITRDIDGRYAHDGVEDDADLYFESRTIAKYIHLVKNGTGPLSIEVERRSGGFNRLVVIDESSMVNLEDFAAFLRLMPDAQFLFVGDTDQLPSIAAGDVFQNLCETGVIPVSRLTINHRSKSAMAILENVQKIHDGDVDLKKEPDIFDIEYFDAEDEDMLKFAVKAYLGELKIVRNVADILMIVPKNAKGLCCVSHMNTILRDELNPVSTAALHNRSSRDVLIVKMPGNEIDGMIYNDPVLKKNLRMRIGDRVVITQNNSATGALNNADSSVVNGDRGYIREYIVESPGRRDEVCKAHIELDDGRIVIMEGENLKYVELAYATTVHKAQGCEFHSVFFIAQSEMSYGADFANRNLIYTACTRAKRHVHVIGLQSTVEHCIRTERTHRDSMLAHRIAGLMN